MILQYGYMGIDFSRSFFSAHFNKKTTLIEFTWQEIWDVEISKWPEEYVVCFFDYLNEAFPTLDLILILSVTEGFYIVYTKPIQLQNLLSKNRALLYQQLKRCDEVDYEFYFNSPFQGNIGYLLDGLIYVFDAETRVFTLNPITKEEFRHQKEHNVKTFKVYDFFRKKL